ncbi:hypothetical protein A3731_00740 [Roseovarius sp. HI0049]|nr:hypothetical protein A3731_00740 [Roseovarius sp. HI0049]
MKNYIQAGNVLTAAAPAGGVSSGDPVQIGNLFGVAATDAEAGADVEIAVTGVFALPKAAVSASAGDVAFFDASAGDVTTDDDTGANNRVGIFTEDAASGAATARVRLDGAAS